MSIDFILQRGFRTISNRPRQTLGGVVLTKSLASVTWQVRIYREFFSTAKPEDWSQLVELSRIGGSASKRKLIAQAFTHSLRHWAQTFTYLRQQGTEAGVESRLADE